MALSASTSAKEHDVVSLWPGRRAVPARPAGTSRSSRAYDRNYRHHGAQEVDPRVTLIGRILRLASLDELRPVINVVKGNMSLVGPRPHDRRRGGDRA